MNQTPVLAAAPRNQKNFNQNTVRTASKSELIDGRVFQKPSADRWHNIIRANFVIAIGSRIQRTHTEIYAGDMQVQVGKSSVLFPDLAVVSGEPHFTDAQFATLTNPTAVIDVFSPTAAAQDRTQRMEGFLAIPSIKEVLLVNENEMRVEHYARQQVKQWVYRIYNERDDVIVLDSLNVRVSLSEVYSQVRFGESEFSSKAIN